MVHRRARASVEDARERSGADAGQLRKALLVHVQLVHELTDAVFEFVHYSVSFVVSKSSQGAFSLPFSCIECSLGL